MNGSKKYSVVAKFKEEKIMHRIEQAQQTIEKLQNEAEVLRLREREERSHIPFGQPNIIGRRDIIVRT